MNDMQSDLKYEIPARAYINAQIIQEVISLPDFDKAVKSVLNYPNYKNKFSSYHFQNPAYVVSLLYCLIAVPKELWLRKMTKKEFDNIDPWIYFSKKLNVNGKTDTKEFIRRLRNSVSHANFSVSPEMKFVFWDKYPNESSNSWEVEITSANLMSFLTKIGSILSNYGLALRS